MIKYSFLKFEQLIYNEKNYEPDLRLNIIKKIGNQAFTTDYAIAIGAQVRNSDLFDDLEHRISPYWTRKTTSNEQVIKTIYDNIILTYAPKDKRLANRPVIYNYLNYKELNDCNINGLEGVVNFGYYPQTVVETSLNDTLEQLYNDNELIATSNYYTSNKNDNNNKLEYTKNPEYIYLGEKYVRVIINCDEEECLLSNNNVYKKGDCVWFKVEPVRWYISNIDNIMISEKLLFAGIPYDEKGLSVFEYSTINNYLNNYFSKEIIQNNKISNLTLYEQIDILKTIIHDINNNTPYIDSKEIISNLITKLSNILDYLNKNDNNLILNINDEIKEELNQILNLYIKLYSNLCIDNTDILPKRLTKKEV